MKYDGHTTEEKYKRIREMGSYPIRSAGGRSDEPVSDEASKIEDMQESIDQMGMAIVALEGEVESLKGEVGPSLSQHDTEIASLWEQIKLMEGNDG